MNKFKVGQVVMTCGISEKSKADPKFFEFVNKCFNKHLKGDWGNLCKEDKELNDKAVANGDDRIFSKYNFDGDTSIYIITEWDRSYTTILFPSEY